MAVGAFCGSAQSIGERQPHKNTNTDLSCTHVPCVPSRNNLPHAPALPLSPCPTQVHVLLHDRGSNTIVSGGADGWVRLWDFNKINEAGG